MKFKRKFLGHTEHTVCHRPYRPSLVIPDILKCHGKKEKRKEGFGKIVIYNFIQKYLDNDREFIYLFIFFIYTPLPWI